MEKNFYKKKSKQRTQVSNGQPREEPWKQRKGGEYQEIINKIELVNLMLNKLF